MSDRDADLLPQLSRLLGGIGFSAQSTVARRRGFRFADEIRGLGDAAESREEFELGIGAQTGGGGSNVRAGLGGSRKGSNLVSIKDVGAIPRQKLSPSGTVLTGPAGFIPEVDRGRRRPGRFN